MKIYLSNCSWRRKHKIKWTS